MQFWIQQSWNTFLRNFEPNKKPNLINQEQEKSLVICKIECLRMAKKRSVDVIVRNPYHQYGLHYALYHGCDDLKFPM